MTTTTLDSKDVSERLVLAFDFSAGLASGETVDSFVVTVSDASGQDSSPSDVLNGAGAVSGGNTVLQPVRAGLAGNSYLIKVVATTSNANKVLVLKATLPVE